MENKFKLKLGDKELIVEIRKLAEQANGEALVRCGDTLVLATAVVSDREREGIDFFPLTVDYEERFYAAGKILGSRYIRRESRPSDEAILTSRLIDRAIRPRFPENLLKDIQVVITCLSWDGENDPDVLGLLAASLALSVSNIPWSGPLGILRIGKINNEFVINPDYGQREKSQIDLVVSAFQPLKGDNLLLNMIEAEGEEVEEKTILEAYQFAKSYFKKLIDFQNQIIKKVGKEKISIELPLKDLELEKEIKDFLADKLENVLFRSDKTERSKETNQLKEDLIYFLEEKFPSSPFDNEKRKCAQKFFEKEVERLIHQNVIEKSKRPDGRKLDEIREISVEVGLLPRTHGSALFSRGETRALSILTLGAPEDQKLLEGMEIIGKKRFMHHYNFPPYCTGEVKPMRGPGRREIGHGMLAEKALMSLVPDFEEFPYTMRIVSEILSSNGSSSMASTCSSSLALMDAGVPIKSAAAGIALGLMTNQKGEYKILTDIQGPEDHYGDMDFKIAGTKNGITAIQMDVKIEGITEEIVKETLSQGKKALLQIQDKMEKVISKPRAQLSLYAPRVLTLQINPEKIREVVGPGGKIINEIIGKCGVAIDIQPSGLIYITSDSEESGEKAVTWIKNITREVKVGEVFQGLVKRIINFGAFVEVLPNQEGLVHISQLAPYRVEKVEDVVKVGDVIPVKVISVDEQGRINLSLKEAKH